MEEKYGYYKGAFVFILKMGLTCMVCKRENNILVSYAVSYTVWENMFPVQILTILWLVATCFSNLVFRCRHQANLHKSRKLTSQLSSISFWILWDRSDNIFATHVLNQGLNWRNEGRWRGSGIRKCHGREFLSYWRNRDYTIECGNSVFVPCLMWKLTYLYFSSIHTWILEGSLSLKII